jgi:hypothetical protein
MEYADVLWDGCMDGESDLLELTNMNLLKS